MDLQVVWNVKEVELSSFTKISFELNYSILVVSCIMPFEMYENQPFKILLLRNFENLFTRTVSKLIFTEL